MRILEAIKITFKASKRNSNFELMRITSMLLIIIGHIFSWGGITENSTVYLQKWIYVIYAIMIVHVNSFVLLTGFFQSQSKKFSYKKVFKLLFYVWFYNNLITIMGMRLGWFEVLKKDFINTLIPFKYESHWFIYVFVFLYCLTPYLNKLINNISQKKYRELLYILFIFCSIMPSLFVDNFNYFYRGFSIINFIFMYFIGGYIRKYFDIIKNKKIAYLIPIMIIPMIINYILYRTNLFEYKIFISYNNPFVIISSVAYFLIFSLVRLKSKIINFFSRHVIEIYIISEMPRFRSIIYHSFGLSLPIYTSRRIIIYAIIIDIIIFISGTIIAYCRQLIFNIIGSFFNKKNQI